MKRLLVFIVVPLLFTSCLTTNAGIKQNYDIKALNAQLETLNEVIKQHDEQIIVLNDKEKAILDDMDINLSKMEELYNNKDNKLKEIKTVLLAYELYSVNLNEDEKIIAKSLAYDKIKEIIDEEN